MQRGRKQPSAQLARAGTGDREIWAIWAKQRPEREARASSQLPNLERVPNFQIWKWATGSSNTHPIDALHQCRTAPQSLVLTLRRACGTVMDHDVMCVFVECGSWYRSEAGTRGGTGRSRLGVTETGNGYAVRQLRRTRGDVTGCLSRQPPSPSGGSKTKHNSMIGTSQRHKASC